MWKHSRAVLKTYTTRWAVWGMVLIFAMICVSTGLSSRGRNVSAVDQWWSNSRSILSAEDINSSLSRRSDEPVDLYFGMLAYELQQDGVGEGLSEAARNSAVEARVLEVIAPLQQIVELKCMAWDIRDETLRRIGTIRTLREVSLTQTLQHEPLDLSPLANLPELETLELRFLNPGDISLAALAACPKLRVLRLAGPELVVPTRLREIALLPALRVLELPRLDGFPESIQALEELRAANNLREIRLEVSWDSSRELADVQARVPRVPVRPRLYSPSRVQALNTMGIFGFAMFSILSLIPAMQFSLPLAELAPGYKRAHRRVTWVLLAGVLLISTGTLLVSGSHVFPTLAALACLLLFMVSFGISTNVSLPANGWETASRILPIPVLIAVSFWLVSQPLQVDTYLMGRLNGLALLAACGAAWSGWRLTRGLETMCRDRQESGLLVTGDANAWQAAVWKTQEERDRRAARPGRAKERSADPTQNMAKVTAILGWSALALACADRWGMLGEWNTREWPQMSWQLGLLQLTIMGGMSICMTWWTKAPFLAGDIVRPPLRREHLNQLFLDVGRDCLRLLPLLLAFSLHIFGRREFSLSTGSAGWLVPVSMAGAAAICCWACTLWVMPVRSKLNMLLVSAGLGLATMAAFMGVVYSLSAAHGTLSAALPDAGALAGGAGIVAVLALGAIGAARAYYTRLEWGKIR